MARGGSDMLPTRSTHSVGDWNDARILLALIRAGSISGAAQALDTTEGRVARRLRSLESQSGALFHRSTKGLTATNLGRDLVRAAKALERSAGHFDRRLTDVTPHGGTVTLAASGATFAYVLLPDLAVFERAHPSVQLRLTTTVSANHVADAAEVNVIAPSPGQSIDSGRDVECYRLGQMTMLLHAGKPFLDNRSPPQSISDLLNLPLIHDSSFSLDDGLEPWNALVSEHRNRGLAPLHMIDSGTARIDAMASGLGLSLAATFGQAIDSRLRVVPVGFPTMPIEFWAVIRRDALSFPSVQAVRDFVLQAFARRRTWFRDVGRIRDRAVDVFATEDR